MRPRSALFLMFVALLCVAADGKLSSGEWKQIEADAEACVEKKRSEALRDLLDRAVKDQSIRCLKLVEKIAGLPDSDWALSACTKAVQDLDSKDVHKELRKDVVAAK